MLPQLGNFKKSSFQPRAKSILHDSSRKDCLNSRNYLSISTLTERKANAPLIDQMQNELRSISLKSPLGRFGAKKASVPRADLDRMPSLTQNLASAYLQQTLQRTLPPSHWMN